MTPREQMAEAERIARELHNGQRDEATGAPYIEHVARVVALVADDDAKTVAWLHDVVEDTPLREGDLRRRGFPPHIVGAVALLTRAPAPDSYETYIDRLTPAARRLAVKVKIADLLDHLRPETPDGFWLMRPKLRDRYRAALMALTTTEA